MRLIIFVKIPERVEPIPLDIIDDRPSQSVLDDILVVAKLFIKNDPVTHYYLSCNGTKLDLSLQLSRNGVKNGTLLDLIKTNDKVSSVKRPEFKGVAVQEMPADTIQEPKSIKKPQKKTEQQGIPGKKIDFD